MTCIVVCDPSHISTNMVISNLIIAHKCCVAKSLESWAAELLGGVELYLSWNAPCVCLCFYVSEEEEEGGGGCPMPGGNVRDR